MQRMWSSSHIAGGNAAYVEDMYERYLRDPNSVEVQWRDYFEKLPRSAVEEQTSRTLLSRRILS